MKSSLILMLLIFTFAFPKSSTNNEDYIRLISDVHEFYKSTSITFFYGSDTGKSEKDEILNIAITFSRRKIMTLLLTFEESEKLGYCRDQEKGSSQITIFVIFITTEKSLQKYMHQLQLAKKLPPNYRIHFFRQLFIFMRISSGNEKPLLDFCTNPIGNPFSLRFDSQTLVKCYDETKIREWYSVTGNETDMYDLATLDNGNQLILRTNCTMYARRGGLRGKRLKTVATKTAVEFRRKGTELGGYIGKIVELAKEALNFTLEFGPDEETVGIWNESTKTWSKALNLLYRAKIDLLASDITLTPERLRVFDFSVPLLIEENLLYIKKPEGSARWTQYIKPFSIGIWTCIIGFVFAIPLLLTFMEIKIGSLYIFSSLISENYLNVWGIFCQQGLPEFPTATILRIAYCSILTLSLIIWSAYCASFTSLLNVPNSAMLLQSVDDFLADGSYKLIVLKDSADYEFFQRTTSDAKFKVMNRLMLPKDRLPETIKAGFKMVCEERVAFYISYKLKYHDDIIKCEVYKIFTNNFNPLAIAYPKNSQYAVVIDYCVQKLRNFGLLNHLQRNFLKTFALTSKVQRDNYKHVELPVIVFPLAIVVCGIILGATIFGLEKGYFYYKNSKKRNKVESSSSNTSISSDSSDFHGHQNEINIEEKTPNIKFLHSDYEHRIVITPGDDTVHLQI